MKSTSGNASAFLSGKYITMKKIILSFLSLFVLISYSYAWNQRPNLDPKSCAVYAPYGQITVTIKVDTTLLCREGYFTLHDNVAKVPVWTAWAVTPERVNGCVPRDDAFVADDSLPKGKRSTPSDYDNTGYDQGHIANASHQSWDVQVQLESFLMSNMAPQLPGLNRGIWKLLESSTGAWVYERKHTLLVYAGSIYDTETDKKIGPNRIVVPHAFYKIIVDRQTGETFAFIFPQAEDLGTDISKFQVTVADVEKSTGLTFPLPQNTDKNSKLQLWSANFKNVMTDKKIVCKK